ncbi:recombinase family protein [Streptomyces sp. BV286]|uniref:recombinase family protein n=1 Tax=Streptomyces sp. BV286 TaxID=2849672 RepID=UPI0027E4F934|nr:recombinase family protein [Streptomyces sp. BV286]
MQDLTAQRAILLGLDVPEGRIYLDHGLTGTNRERPCLTQGLAAVRAGDTLVVPKLDRLARSVPTPATSATPSPPAAPSSRSVAPSTTPPTASSTATTPAPSPRPATTDRSKPPTCRPLPPSPRKPVSISWPSASPMKDGTGGRRRGAGSCGRPSRGRHLPPHRTRAKARPGHGRSESVGPVPP